MGRVADDRLLLRRPLPDDITTTTMPVAMPMRTSSFNPRDRFQSSPR